MTTVRNLDFQMEPRAWSLEEVERLRALWKEHGGGARKIGGIMGRTKNSIIGMSRRLSLQYHGGRAVEIAKNHPASILAESLFQARVIDPDSNVLKSGDNQRKIGKVVQKGAWKGFPIYSLTLEERATCPRTCAEWGRCYGNNMSLAKRYRHGPELLEQISLELEALQQRFPTGFAVRLHILGDFVSSAYVEFWGAALEKYPALHVFGYTARQEGARIGDAIAHLRRQCWDRFAIRTSGASAGPRTLVIDREGDAGDAIICPAQLGKTSNCSTCALCWSPTAKDKPIAFIRH
jgi:hypothetical protein